MKSFFNRIAGLSQCLPRQGAILTAMIVFLAGTGLQAQIPDGNFNTYDAAWWNNLALIKLGAVVIYSTPLANGASPNLLIDGQPVTLSFSKKKPTYPELIVVDLGRSYKINTVALKFSNSVKIKVYILKSKPDSHTSWANLIVGLQPDGILNSSDITDSLHGVEGEYLVLICDADPGLFSDLYVTGYPSTNRRDLEGYRNHGYNQGPLGETPLPHSDFLPPEPHVGPQSH